MRAQGPAPAPPAPLLLAALASLLPTSGCTAVLYQRRGKPLAHVDLALTPEHNASDAWSIYARVAGHAGNQSTHSHLSKPLSHKSTAPAHAFLKAFFVVAVAEVFDKTWFMSLILALKFGWPQALVGGYTGLVIHCVLSALLGFGFSKLLKPSILHFITAGLFFFFTLLYAKDWYFAEPETNMIESGKAEANEAIDDTPDTGDVKRPLVTKLGRLRQNGLFQSFLAVFIAEWGDRTQMAMIGLHSSLPVVPVFLGSALAFFVLTVSAIIVAYFIARAQLSERLVMGTASLSFLIFAILALRDGLEAKNLGH